MIRILSPGGQSVNDLGESSQFQASVHKQFARRGTLDAVAREPALSSFILCVRGVPAIPSVRSDRTAARATAAALPHRTLVCDQPSALKGT